MYVLLDLANKRTVDCPDQTYSNILCTWVSAGCDITYPNLDAAGKLLLDYDTQEVVKIFSSLIL